MAGGSGASGHHGGLTIEPRGKTSRDRLQIDWVYPVWKPAEQTAQSGTVVAEVEHALPLEQAWTQVAGGDKRPLLVVRECELCKGTDHALLDRSLDNEPVLLLTQWFRCVKLPTNVLSDQHPFHALFAGKPGEPVAHVFFSDPDGGNRKELLGGQSQADVLEAMYAALDRTYQGDARKVVKELRTVLSQYDRLDNLERDARSRIDKETENNGPGSERLPRLEAELKKIEQDRADLLAREKKLRALAFKNLGDAASPAQPASAK